MAYKKYEYFKLNFNYETATEFIEKSSGYKFQYDGITFFIEKYGEKMPTYTATEEKSGLKVLSGYKKLKYLKDDIIENIDKIKAALDREKNWLPQKKKSVRSKLRMRFPTRSAKNVAAIW